MSEFQVWPHLRKAMKDLGRAVQDFFHALASPIELLRWFGKKKWQSFARKHLSFWVAMLLTPFVVLREWPELQELVANIAQHKWPSLHQLFIVVLLLGVVYTLKLELVDKEYAVSNQEGLFHIGVRRANDELEKFASATKDTETAFFEFVELLLEIAAQTFSLGARVHTGLMVKVPDRESLKLVKSSNQAGYDNDLEIPLPAGDDCSKSGPAGVAFAKNCLVYVPKVDPDKPRRAWLFIQAPRNPHSFVPSQAVNCWVKSKQKDQDRFQSTIAVPIPGLGVLNFSTHRKDPFIYRDFLMAQYFARVLSQASVLRRHKLSQAKKSE